MPAMCRLIVRPITVRLAPPACRWTGVRDMTPTMTACPVTRPASPATACGEALIRDREPRGSGAGAPAGAVADAARAVSNGSGRSATTRTPAATTAATPVTSRGPARAGTPTAPASAAPGRVRFGPATAPTVVAHTTSPRERARAPGSARSVAAKRACRFDALPTPSSTIPTIRSGNERTTAARTARDAPAAATSQPVESAGRRPRRTASRASGTAAAAAPSVVQVEAIPDHAADPDRSSASRAPTDTAAPIPIPPATCVTASSGTIRRCTALRCRRASTPRAYDRPVGWTFVSERELRADCARCAALCCVGPAFAASADFALDKPAGTPCPNLRDDFRCGIHAELATAGFRGCTVYDCFGAGQRVTAATRDGQGRPTDWRQTPAVGPAMFAALATTRMLHEL